DRRPRPAAEAVAPQRGRRSAAGDRDRRARSRDRSRARSGARTVTNERRGMIARRITSRAEWAAARQELLAREKEHTRLGDELARQRRELPWVRLEKEYR